MHKATLRLFNAIQVPALDLTNLPLVIDRHVENGYVLHPAISRDEDILDAIESIVGISGEKANSAFHKSWAVVRDTPMAVLVVQQIVHYLTTYGFESLGIYSADTVYIPHEHLDVLAIREDIPLVVIEAMTPVNLLNAIVTLGSSGIALSPETLNDIMVIVKQNRYGSAFVESIENRELKSLLYQYYDLAPKQPVEFLRWAITRLTGETLLIKNKDLFDKLASASAGEVDSLMRKAPPNLASIFYRFKPLFLAMRKAADDKRFFNQLRRKAVEQHRPMPRDYLNDVTMHIKHGTLDFGNLGDALDKANSFRKIRLLYALVYRMEPVESIVYRVRNGKAWASSFDAAVYSVKDIMAAYEAVKDSLVLDLSHVTGRTIFIPAYIDYPLPATEKQFTGNFPTGTSVSVPNDMIFGIHWTDTDRRIDLDLALVSAEGKIGWDADYRSDDQAMLFSGDMTAAPLPNGAAELFYVRSGTEPQLITVNYYNHEKDHPVEMRILVTHEVPSNFGMNYVVDVNNILALTPITVSKKQNIIGLVANDKFYFANVSGLGNAISSRVDDKTRQTREYLLHNLRGSISLREILIAAGADVVSKAPDRDYIDLSPAVLDKSTIVNLITGV